MKWRSAPLVVTMLLMAISPRTALAMDNDPVYKAVYGSPVYGSPWKDPAVAREQAKDWVLAGCSPYDPDQTANMHESWLNMCQHAAHDLLAEYKQFLNPKLVAALLADTNSAPARPRNLILSCPAPQQPAWRRENLMFFIDGKQAPAINNWSGQPGWVTVAAPNLAQRMCEGTLIGTSYNYLQFQYKWVHDETDWFQAGTSGSTTRRKGKIIDIENGTIVTVADYMAFCQEHGMTQQTPTRPQEYAAQANHEHAAAGAVAAYVSPLQGDFDREADLQPQTFDDNYYRRQLPARYPELYGYAARSERRAARSERRAAPPAALPAAATQDIRFLQELKVREGLEGTLRWNHRDLWKDITEKISPEDRQKLLRAYEDTHSMNGETFSAPSPHPRDGFMQSDYTIQSQEGGYYMVMQDGNTKRRFRMASSSKLKRGECLDNSYYFKDE